MSEEVLVTRKGQVTIPVRLRKKYGIRAGSHLQVEDTDDGILLKPRTSIFDLAGSGSKHATVEEAREIIDWLRAKDT